jgi:hypothetical protein
MYDLMWDEAVDVQDADPESDPLALEPDVAACHPVPADPRR